MPDALTDLGFRHAPVALLVLSERRIQRVNAAFEALFGWTQAQLEGRSVRLLYPSVAEFTRIGTRWQASLTSAEPQQDERFMKLRNEDIVWMRVRGRSLTPTAPFRVTVWSFEPRATGEPAMLSPREQAVAQHVVNGLTSKEMAQLMGLSPRTIEVHRAAILRKLGVRSSAEMVARLLSGGPD